MISFERFNSWLTTYKEIIEKEEKLNNDLQEFSRDFGGFYLEDVHDLILDILKTITHDNDDWIGYYIYELEWGTKWQENSVTEMDGTPIKLQTIEDLYNLLESEYVEDEETKI